MLISFKQLKLTNSFFNSLLLCTEFRYSNQFGDCSLVRTINTISQYVRLQIINVFAASNVYCVPSKQSYQTIMDTVVETGRMLGAVYKGRPANGGGL